MSGARLKKQTEKITVRKNTSEENGTRKHST
jgi:hypothetical protein